MDFETIIWTIAVGVLTTVITNYAAKAFASTKNTLRNASRGLLVQFRLHALSTAVKRRIYLRQIRNDTHSLIRHVAQMVLLTNLFGALYFAGLIGSSDFYVRMFFSMLSGVFVGDAMKSVRDFRATMTEQRFAKVEHKLERTIAKLSQKLGLDPDAVLASEEGVHVYSMYFEREEMLKSKRGDAPQIASVSVDDKVPVISADDKAERLK